MYSSRFSDLGCLVTSETLGVQKMVLEEETQSQRVGTRYPFFHGLSKKSKWSGFKEDPENKLNLCPGAQRIGGTVPSKHDTRASTLSLASMFIAMYASLFIYPLFRCLAMCRLIHYYVCISSSFSFCGILHRLVHSFSFNDSALIYWKNPQYTIGPFTSMMCWA